MAQRKTKAKRAKKPAAAVNILAWEDDPEGRAPTLRPAPNPAAKPLAYQFPTPAPPPGQYETSSADFRYWAAAEALRRGSAFWAPLLSRPSWQVGAVLPVILDAGEDLNAYYDRQALNFFHGPSGNRTVYSGESPDVACHEMGHAILDTLKPALWDAATHEVPAFHEAFGDISAILCALQLPSIRATVLTETGGRLARSSRLSRLAEQLASAIRLQSPDAVDRDCLRNAANSFSYRDPLTLPSRAPASQLSSEPHSFSRVFTGAVLVALADMLTATARDAAAPTEAELLRVSGDLGSIIVEGILEAPVVSNFFSQVATGMVRAGASLDEQYGRALNAAFLKKGILSLQSAISISRLDPVTLRARTERASAPAPMLRIALDGIHFGLGNRALLVQAASHPRSLSVASAAPGGGPLPPASSDVAATAFVEDLFRHGRVEIDKQAGIAARFVSSRSLKTHRLVPEDDGVALQRKLFDCGHVHD